MITHYICNGAKVNTPQGEGIIHKWVSHDLPDKRKIRYIEVLITATKKLVKFHNTEGKFEFPMLSYVLDNLDSNSEQDLDSEQDSEFQELPARERLQNIIDTMDDEHIDSLLNILTLNQ